MRIMSRSAKNTGGSTMTGRLRPGGSGAGVGCKLRLPTIDATIVEGQADRVRRRGATPHGLDAVAVILAGIDLDL
jgi:hypothetical protein